MNKIAMKAQFRDIRDKIERAANLLDGALGDAQALRKELLLDGRSEEWRDWDAYVVSWIGAINSDAGLLLEALERQEAALLRKGVSHE